MEQGKNKQPKVESKQRKPKSVKPEQIGQFVSNGVKLLLYGAVIVVMGIGLLWSFSRPTTTVSQDNSNSYLPVVVNQQAGMTIEMVMEMVNGYCADGQIEGDGLCNSLRAKLDAAIESRDRGSLSCNQLVAFIKEVGAQKNKKMSSNVANHLIESAGQACTDISVTPTVEPTVTPKSSYTPGVVFATVIIPTQPPPTPTPTPTPTTPTNPDGSATVGGYIFSPPQAVNVQADIESKIFGWLLGASNTLVDISTQQVLAINTQTGETTALGPKIDEVFASSAFQIMKNKQVLFRKGKDLWLTALDDIASEPLPLTDTRGSLTIGPDGEEIWLYNEWTQQLTIIGKDGQINDGDEKFIPAFTLFSKTQPENIISPSGTTNYNTGWTMFRTSNYLRLVDLYSGEFKEVGISQHELIRRAYWSPDGTKVAMLLQPDINGTIDYISLSVFDVITEQLKDIETEFKFITNVTWAPDSENLLFSADTGVKIRGERDQYDTTTLFLVNVNSPKLQPIPSFPTDAHLGFVDQLSWSPDGQSIVLSGYIPDNPSILHRIDVTKP